MPTIQQLIRASRKKITKNNKKIQRSRTWMKLARENPEYKLFFGTEWKIEHFVVNETHLVWVRNMQCTVIFSITVRTIIFHYKNALNILFI